ncbi:MAG TPA: DUF4249 domain-containing protein [Chitinophagaceae bacterium]|nr:DUF4249 domain-containing protein [Chitinophagaceae bacterium]
MARLANWKRVYKTTIGWLLVAGCITPFDPPAISNPTADLVVEGFINTGNGPTDFMLTRTSSLSGISQPAPELNAQVSVEDGQGNIFPLTEIGNGNYTLSSLGSDTTGKFRLQIHTADGEQFISDYDSAVSTPPIDSVSWGLESGDLHIYVNSHDPTGQVDYYRWNYQETWEFHSYYKSYLEWLGGAVVARPPGQEAYTCWHADQSTDILISSASGLSSDIISRFPLTVVADHSKQISVLYSILVDQFGMSQAAYQYWQALEKNTEQTGTIFDPLPFTADGNLHCVTNPAEKVIGFVSAGSEQQQRIFISNAALPADWNIEPDCPLVVVPADSVQFFFGISELLPISQDGVSAYFASEATCVDCTLTGTNVKPSFWP